LPDDIRDEAKVDKHPTCSYMQFFPERNDGYLNKYNRLTTVACQANTDVSPCTSTAAVIEYIVKYTVKPETKSASYKEMASKIIPFVNENRPYQSIVTKLMNKLIGERDYSAQEVMHLLLNLELSQGSRAFLSVDLRHPDEHSHLYRVDAGKTRRGLSVLEHYMQRPADLNNVSYYTFLRSHGHRAPYNLRTRSLDRILNYFPRYPADEVENYGRAKLMLHHPFRKLDDLLFIEAIHNEQCANYFKAFEVCRERCNHPHDGFDDEIPQPEESVHKDTQEDPDEEALNNMDAEWGELARVLPDCNGGNVDAWDILGRRPEDQVDWSERVGTYPNLQGDWWKTQKADHAIVSCDLGDITPYHELEVKQKLLWNTYVDHYNSLAVSTDPLYLHVDGKAGTGKTTVIKSMCAEVDCLAAELGLPSPIFRAVPTGVAACNFGGSTLHSLL
jgi:ATP-dependent DNA helicase PIF1